MTVTITLSWNERKQIEESLARWMALYLQEKAPEWQPYIQSAYNRFAATLGDPGIVTMEVPEFEMRWACEGITYQRSLVQYAGPEPQIGTFGPANFRLGPPERVHLGPLLRKMVRAMGTINETTNPELLTDPPFQ